ncbi:MAG: hypothetical protein OEY28_00920 [Nitrospira sp.]|nr:hypothetical protein [Nitrospira sp.]
MSVELEDEFQKELIEVFVQEAQEWLQQIHVALDELQQGPSPERHLKLAQTIKVGITNMGGSAATIGLSEVEQASFAAIPFVEAVQDPSATIAAGDFVAVCKQLGQIHDLLTRATGVAFEAEAAPERSNGLPVNVQTSELLAVLQRFREGPGKQTAAGRNLIQIVIDQVEGLKKSGIESCDVISLKEFLDRWSEGEDGFVESVQAQIPVVLDEIGRLKNGAGEAGQASERLQAVVEQVAQLVSIAQQVNASQAVMFFTGLQGFLTIVMQRRVAVKVQTYQAVELRLHEIIKAIQEWGTAGRTERSAIAGVLGN